MASNNHKSAVNVERLREKLQSEYSFISSVLDRVPSIYSQDNDDENEENGNRKPLSRANALLSKSGDASRAYTVEELQERLDSLKSKKKPGFKDLVKQKNLETKLKNKKKRDEKMSKPNKMNKMKRMEKLEKPKLHAGKNGSSDNLTKQKPSKPVFNSEGKMVFSKFDFSGSFDETKKKKKEIKDPKKILEKLKQKKETLKKLKEEGKDAKVSELVKKEAWGNALKKAEGIKVKDDPELLKKSIRRQESKKKSSAKKWASREHGIKKAMKERVEKRESNIQARKDSNKQKKRANAIKKGRIVPGF